MRSVGNDIIDLSLTDPARAQNPRFHSKILTAQELAHHRQFSQLAFPVWLWLHWSVKESAYKFLKRLDTSLIFSPLKIEVISLEFSPIPPNSPFNVHGVCRFADQTLSFRSIITEECVFTLVYSDGQFDSLHWGMEFIGEATPEVQSAAVRHFVLSYMNRLLPDNDYAFIKDEFGVPALRNAVAIGLPDLPVSLTHHGRCVGWVINITHDC